MSDPVWFYAQGDTEKGPLTTAQIKALAAAGKIRRDDFVWKEGMETWATARDITELFGSESKPAGKRSTQTPEPKTSPSVEKAVSSSGSVGPSTVVAGMLVVLLARGCDSLADRYATRLEAIAETSQRHFDDQWQAEDLRLQRAMQSLGSGGDAQGQREQLTQQLKQLNDNMQARRRELQATTWRDQGTAAEDAKADSAQWGFWREAAFMVGTLMLTMGLLAVAWGSTGPERWFSLAVLAAIISSVYLAGALP